MEVGIALDFVGLVLTRTGGIGNGKNSTQKIGRDAKPYAPFEQGAECSPAPCPKSISKVIAAFGSETK
jgi:hypothetical protein